MAGAVYLTPTQTLSRSPSGVKLQPLNRPYSPGWHAERAKTPPSMQKKPEIVMDALTFLDKRSKRALIMNSVNKFKLDATAKLSEAREAGTPDKYITEALRRTHVNGTVRTLNFSDDAPAIAGSLRPKYSSSKATTISIAMDFLKARRARNEDAKIDKVKSTVSDLAQKFAAESGVPEYLLDDAVADLLDKFENPQAVEADA